MTPLKKHAQSLLPTLLLCSMFLLSSMSGYAQGPPSLPVSGTVDKGPAGDWYYALNGKKVGPVKGNLVASGIKSGTITKASLVWTQGMADWTNAEKVAALAPYFPASAKPQLGVTTKPPQGAPPKGGAPRILGTGAAKGGMKGKGAPPKGGLITVPSPGMSGKAINAPGKPQPTVATGANQHPPKNLTEPQKEEWYEVKLRIDQLEKIAKKTPEQEEDLLALKELLLILGNL